MHRVPLMLGGQKLGHWFMHLLILPFFFSTGMIEFYLLMFEDFTYTIIEIITYFLSQFYKI